VNSRPTDNPSTTHRIKTGCGWLYITVCPGDYKEVFFKLGKTGGCAAAHLQALAMTFSMAWRAGVPLESMVNNLQSINCPSPMWSEGIHVLSCEDGIAHVLKPYCEEEIKNGL
jgi:ribonucleoside-diphosphate reductase alpha chain